MERRLREIEREKAEVRAQLEEVRRWADAVPDAAQMCQEPRLREAAIPEGYHRADGAFSPSDCVWDGAGVLEREAADAPVDETALDFTPGPEGLDTKRVVMPRLQRTDLLRPALGGAAVAPRLAAPAHDRFRNYFGTAGLKRVREARKEQGSQRIRAVWVRAEIALLAEDPGQARLAAERALDLAEEAGAPRHVAKSLLFAGVAATAQHQVGAAIDLLSRAAVLAEGLGARPLIWPSRAMLGALQQESAPEQAAQSLEAARAVVREITADLAPDLADSWLARGDVRALLG